MLDRYWEERAGVWHITQLKSYAVGRIATRVSTTLERLAELEIDTVARLEVLGWTDHNGEKAANAVRLIRGSGMKTAKAAWKALEEYRKRVPLSYDEFARSAASDACRYGPRELY